MTIKMKNHIFIQGRVSSTRLPGKILMKIFDKTILELIVERLDRVKNVDKMILITGSNDKNALLVKEAEKIGLDHFCGSEQNLLDRFYNASKKFFPDNIIRVTADCPLIDFNLIDKGLKIFLENNYDLVNVGRKSNYPHGLDYEIFKTTALELAWKKTRSGFDSTEKFIQTFICPTDYILQSNDFKKFELINDDDLSQMRLTLDYKEDFELISKVYEKLYNNKQFFTLEDILDLFKKNPSLSLINQKYV
ncbi:Acylneuraminate cytidylyltransferase [Nitrosotalea devaniterrae]|uniref:Acylneuraminate cytidylyltransferase n=1 Tax=Nitrosotalea devaniterrae TaxID=1078905 RepID=A0A128A0T9_9ARCH|nr:Acylneuraminate cytidylyltransferase [Candidatus Nitrosotalea devanaterra]